MMLALCTFKERSEMAIWDAMAAGPESWISISIEERDVRSELEKDVQGLSPLKSILPAPQSRGNQTWES